ncbi:MAG: ATP-dependent zinc metalloprotease FtsH [Bacilli bacterium]|nr:ATP-dependent zinc metalloprotease FtsH [Bacilli bacterium]
MAGAIGLFIWLAFSNLFRSSDEIDVRQLEETVLYYKFDAAEKEFKKDDYNAANHNRLYAVNYSHSYTTVYVTGRYLNANNNVGSFSVRLDESQWRDGYNYIYVDPNTKATTSVYHESFFSLFSSRIQDARASGIEDTNKVKIIEGNSDAFEVSFWDAWGPTIISTAAIILVSILIFSRLSASVNGANNSINSFNKSPARRADSSKVRFDDVAGCDEEKAEMVELVEYLKDPKKYAKFGARLPKGFLLIGPPGTGKTLLAKAVAGEAGVPFYSISGSDFVEMYVGVGAGRVRDLFRQAKATAPCLIFIDEIDAVGRQRGAGLGGGNDEREQTLNQLLVEMDGFEANSGILVIAATNRDDVLDPALRRAGRFDRTITVSLPDKAGREAILKVHARGKKIDPSVDFGALAKRTVGFSGADLDNVLNEAAILAVRDGKDQVSIEEIDEAIDRRISGPAKSSKGLSAKERKQVAYHEAGHAVIGINLPYSDKVQKITIVPRGNTGGHVLMTPEDDRFLMTKNELIARITGLLGGRTSEEIFFQDVSTGASNDIEQATRLARLMVTEFGMSDLGPIQYERDTGSVFLGRDYASTQRNFSTQIAFEIDKAVRKIIDEAHENARKLLEEKKDQVILIAETLLDKETITAEEIEALCKTGKLPVQEAPAPEAPKEPSEAPSEPSEPVIPDVAESPEPKDPDGTASE